MKPSGLSQKAEASWLYFGFGEDGIDRFGMHSGWRAIRTAEGWHVYDEAETPIFVDDLALEEAEFIRWLEYETEFREAEWNKTDVEISHNVISDTEFEVYLAEGL